MQDPSGQIQWMPLGITGFPLAPCWSAGQETWTGEDVVQFSSNSQGAQLGRETWLSVRCNKILSIKFGTGQNLGHNSRTDPLKSCQLSPMGHYDGYHINGRIHLSDLCFHGNCFHGNKDWIYFNRNYKATLLSRPEFFHEFHENWNH